jgi:hypothetical protein
MVEFFSMKRLNEAIYRPLGGNAETGSLTVPSASTTEQTSRKRGLSNWGRRV